MRIALAAGHHNATGGNDYEIGTTGLLTPRIAAAGRALGLEVRCVQPGDGAGHIAGDVTAVGATVARWAGEGWAADVFLETHTQGVADPAVRGAFGIYPDWPPDTDADARDRLIPDLVARLMAATGMPRFGDGRMSERLTAVGAAGHRLGVFGATAGIRARCTRLLVEYGAHSNPVERALHRDQIWLDRAARATAEALAAFGGVEVAAATAWHVGPGIRAAMEKAGDRPVGPEREVVPGLTRCPGERQLYYWSQDGGHVYAVPRAS